MGFVPKRHLKDNIRDLLNATEYLRRKRVKIAFMLLDADKAFDNVSWLFLMTVQQNMNCGTEFLNCIQSIYTDQHARILINGSLTEY